MSRNLCIIITAFVLSACDPQNEPGSPGSPDASKKADTATATKQEAGAAKTAGPTAVTTPVVAADAAPEGVHNLSSCIGTCEDPKMLATDRATCRLNCENSYGYKPGAAVAEGPGDPVTAAVGCLNRCHMVSGASLETCTAGCKAIAAAAPVAPAPAAIDRLSTCLGTCAADKDVLPTNRATCELGCAQEARVAGPAQAAAPR